MTADREAGSRRRTIEVDRTDAARVAAYKQGAVDYVRNMPDWARQQLYRKPFVGFADGPDTVALIYLHDLASILELLALPGEASILDVACGPGWISEALYRFGYRVTGVDISEDLLAIARERVHALPYPPFDRDPSWVRFQTLDVETEALERRFDAILIYDALHHLVDAESGLRSIRKMLSPAGVLIIKEGAMPAPGSEGEAELIRESEQYTTLEAPFDPEALERLLYEVGFTEVRRFEPALALQPVVSSSWKKMRRALEPPPGPPVNFFLCRQGPPVPAAAPRWGAELTCLEQQLDAQAAHLRIRVVNTGRTVLTAGDDESPGTFEIGCRLRDGEGNLIDEYGGRTPLPRDLGPGEAVEVDVVYGWPAAAQRSPLHLAVDLLSRRRFWLADHGSQPLEIVVEGRG